MKITFPWPAPERRKLVGRLGEPALKEGPRGMDWEGGQSWDVGRRET